MKSMASRVRIYPAPLQKPDIRKRIKWHQSSKANMLCARGNYPPIAIFQMARFERRERVRREAIESVQFSSYGGIAAIHFGEDVLSHQNTSRSNRCILQMRSANFWNALSCGLRRFQHVCEQWRCVISCAMD